VRELLQKSSNIVNIIEENEKELQKAEDGILNLGRVPADHPRSSHYLNKIKTTLEQDRTDIQGIKTSLHDVLRELIIAGFQLED
jgi:hypothetical protein